MFDLTGKIALVTGSGQGVGLGIARTLIDAGATVYVNDLVAERAETAAAELGSNAKALPFNVADFDQVVAAIASASPIDILVNNAGVLRDRTIAKMTLEDWDIVQNVNLKSAFLMCREVQAHMRAAGWGRIVNLSSIAALGAVGEANYSAAKAAIQGLTRTLAIELGRYGITANAVAPGFVVTEMTREVARRMNMPFEEMVGQMLQTIAVGRPGEPDDIAHAVSYFADARAGFVTGQVLYVAGAPRG